jgi:hypothetical protein
MLIGKVLIFSPSEIGAQGEPLSGSSDSAPSKYTTFRLAWQQKGHCVVDAGGFTKFVNPPNLTMIIRHKT